MTQTTHQTLRNIENAVISTPKQALMILLSEKIEGFPLNLIGDQRRYLADYKAHLPTNVHGGLSSEYSIMLFNDHLLILAIIPVHSHSHSIRPVFRRNGGHSRSSSIAPESDRYVVQQCWSLNNVVVMDASGDGK
jgi:hypothetical protein